MKPNLALVAVALVVCVSLAFPVLAQGHDGGEDGERSTSLITVLLSWLPLLILIVLWWTFFKVLRPKRQKALLEKQSIYLDRAIEHMDRVEEKLDAILEEIRKNNA